MLLLVTHLNLGHLHFQCDGDAFNSGTSNMQFLPLLKPDGVTQRDDGNERFPHAYDVMDERSLPYCLQNLHNRQILPCGVSLDEIPAYSTLMVGLFNHTDLTMVDMNLQAGVDVTLFHYRP